MSNEITRNLGNVSATSVSATTTTSTNTILTSGTSTYSPARTVSKSFVISPLNSVINTTTLTIAGWKWNVDTNIYFGLTGVTAGNYVYCIIPNPPQGATLDSIDFYYRINGGARTPNRLSVTIRRQDLTAFTSANLMANTQVTLYATTGYGAVVSTNFVTTGNQTIDTSLYTYFIIITEEQGAGNTPGNNAYSFKCNYTLTTLPND